MLSIAGVVALNALVLVAVAMDVLPWLLAAVLLLPLVALLLRRPQVGILALVALLPFDGLLTIVPHPVIAQAWKEALLIATLGATLLGSSARAATKRPVPSWMVALGGLVAIGVVSAVYAGGITGLYGLKVYFFFALVAVVLWRCPFGERERDRLVTILMVDGVITAAFGVAQQSIGAERLNEWGYPYNTTIRFNAGVLRSFSTFDQPFSFGFYLMVVLLVTVPVVLHDPRRRRNRVFLLLLPLVFGGLLSSIVRGAWLGFAAGLTYLGLYRYRILLLAIPFGLTALLFLPPDVSRSALSSTSSGERAENWEENVGQLARYPLGSGIGTTGSAAERVQLLTGQNVDYYQPDNQYFLVAYELGALGLWWFVLLLGTALAAVRAAADKLSGPDAALASGTAALVVAAIAASVMATLFQISPFDLMFWVLLATVATVDRQPAPVPPARVLLAR